MEIGVGFCIWLGGHELAGKRQGTDEGLRRSRLGRATPDTVAGRSAPSISFSREYKAQ